MRACPRCKTPYASSVEFCGIDGARIEDSDVDPLIGATFDRYRIVEALGGGGMAAVYRAVHTVIDRECALKVLWGELASDRAFAERFRREAQAASRIKHENVVEVLDFGTTKEGASFLLMELLRGRTLSALVRETGSLPPLRAAMLLRDVAAGLAAAHALGFVHRDLKPQNIMVVDARGRERAKILDFGLVFRARGGDDDASLTRTGQTLGTPTYMAPEQIEGGQVTDRSDLYSLGVVLHEMLSGSAPFQGSLADVLVQHASAPPPPLPPSQGLEALAQRLLEKSPARRPESAAAVVREIERLGLVPEGEAPLELPAPRRDDEATSSGAEPRLHADPFTPTEAQTLPPTRPDAAGAARAPGEPPRASAQDGPTPTTTTAAARRAPTGRAGKRPRAVVASLLAVAAAALFVSTGGIDLVRRIRPAVEGAALEVGAKAVASLEQPEIAQAPVDDDAARARLDRDVESALRARGLSVEDVEHMPALRAPWQQFRAARVEGSSGEARRSAAALARAVARAPIPADVLERRLERVRSALDRRAPSLGPKRRAALEKRLAGLAADARRQRTEAERSRILLDVAALAADVEAVPP